MKLEQADLDKIKELSRLRLDDGILSVYLPLDPGVEVHHGYVARLMDILRDLRESRPAEDRSRIDAEAAQLLGFVRESYTPHGSAFIAFSSIPAKLFETYSWQAEVPALARFGPHAFLAPIEALQEDFPETLVALSGHEDARLFRMMLGELQSERHLSDDVPGYQRQGGWAAAHYESDREHHIREHLERIITTIEDMDGERRFEYLVLAGTDETTHALINLLPAGLRARLAGTFRSEMFEPDSVVISRARAIAEKAERGREAGLVETVIALSGSRQAVLGPDRTIEVLGQGGVRRVLIAAGSYYSPSADLIRSLAQQTGASIEVVHGEAEEALARYGGIGAMLRY